MARKAKLAPGSLLTTDDQVRLYEREMGTEAMLRQTKLANANLKRCTCTPSSVRRRWDNSDKPYSRRIHARECAKWRPWMAAAQEPKT